MRRQALAMPGSRRPLRDSVAMTPSPARSAAKPCRMSEWSEPWFRRCSSCDGSEPTTSPDPRVGDLNALRRLPHGALATAIIARRRRRARVPEHRLHRGEVHPRVEQVPRKRAPAIMRREGCDPRAFSEVAETVVHRLLGEPSEKHTPVAVDGQEEGAGLLAT